MATLEEGTPEYEATKAYKEKLEGEKAVVEAKKQLAKRKKKKYLNRWRRVKNSSIP